VATGKLFAIDDISGPFRIDDGPRMTRRHSEKKRIA